VRYLYDTAAGACDREPPPVGYHLLCGTKVLLRDDETDLVENLIVKFSLSRKSL